MKESGKESDRENYDRRERSLYSEGWCAFTEVEAQGKLRTEHYKIKIKM